MQMIVYQQAKDLSSHNVATMINVLPAEYFEKTHLPGSINIPHESPDFTDQVERVIGGKDMPVIVYCASYACDASRKAAVKLERAGFTNVMCYEGGAREWQEKTSGLSSAA